MPFTLSHPAAIAPLWPLVRRNYLPLSALAVGTMVPDFEYLWRLRTEWHWSHAPLGLLTFCLPVGLLALLLWNTVLREPIKRLLALPPSRLSTSFMWWVLAGIAIVVGAATHLLWDRFTHDHTQTITRQYVSSLIGGIIVLIWLVRTLRTGEPRALLAPWRMTVLLAIAAVAAGVGVWNGLRAGISIQRAGVGALHGLAVALLIYGFVARIARLRKGGAEEFVES